MQASLLYARRVPNEHRRARRAPLPRRHRTSLVPAPRSASWQLSGTARLVPLPPARPQASPHLSLGSTFAERPQRARQRPPKALCPCLSRGLKRAWFQTEQRCHTDRVQEETDLGRTNTLPGTGVPSKGKELLENLGGAIPRVQGTEQGQGVRAPVPTTQGVGALLTFTHHLPRSPLPPGGSRPAVPTRRQLRGADCLPPPGQTCRAQNGSLLPPCSAPQWHTFHVRITITPIFCSKARHRQHRPADPGQLPVRPPDRGDLRLLPRHRTDTRRSLRRGAGLRVPQR